MPGGLLEGTYRDAVFPYSGQQWDPKPNKDPNSLCYYTPGAPECDNKKGNALELPPQCYPPQASTGMTCTGTIPCDIAYIRRWYPNVLKYSYATAMHLSENTNAQHLYPGQAEMEHYKLSVPTKMSPSQLKNNTQRIKEAIYMYGPVTAVIPIYKDFGETFKPNTVYWSDPNHVYEVSKHPSNTITGLHHVLIVGWGKDTKGGFWIVKNSWGVWWNYDGYFNVRMGDPLLLAESNCHSALPYNPLTGNVVQPFDHSNGLKKKVLVFILIVVLLLLTAIVLGRVEDSVDRTAFAGQPDRKSADLSTIGG